MCYLWIIVDYTWKLLKTKTPGNIENELDDDQSYSNNSYIIGKSSSNHSNVLTIFSYLFAGAVMPLCHIFSFRINDENFSEFFLDCTQNCNIFYYYAREKLIELLEDCPSMVFGDDLQIFIERNWEMLLNPQKIRSDFVKFVFKNKKLASKYFYFCSNL